ncbi:YisL family protein [Bacillus sp. 1NLA3E]|uniref:YisL family protein n=1 Tax=Bacillus sp. 1NLA3E TaxID=666686 RepID=UPI000247E7CA|nr:YisL family protein [Bacillus sp. 1NLA3E]AGK52206.1 hypothetical protein B1NLA3E_02110 [Bacillus sp. 1NLA3E]
MTHAHLTTIVLTCILFFITILQQSKGKNIKIWQMVLRTSYILIIATGLMLFMSVYNITILYILKAVVGILMIGVFEMIIAWRAKDKSANILWVLFAVVLVMLFVLGFMLPMGIRII